VSAVDDPGTFAAVFAAMFAGHHIGDHVAQTDWQAKTKARPDRVSRATSWRAMAGHILTYHLCVGAALAALLLVDVRFTWPGVVAGLGFSAVTHAFLDRRWPVRWLLEHTGSKAFAESTTPLHGVYLSDQSLHLACLFVSALLVVSIG
jgi:hypothetical protein